MQYIFEQKDKNNLDLINILSEQYMKFLMRKFTRIYKENAFDA